MERSGPRSKESAYARGMASEATLERLRDTLRRIDGRGYKAYRDVAGTWTEGDLALHVDRVQGDPFAAPSRVRVRLDAGEAELPAALCAGRVRRIALEDFLARRVRQAVRREVKGHRGSGKSGSVSVDAGGQEVLERTAVRVGADWVEARLAAGLPAAGRRVLAREAEALLCGELPAVARRALRLDAEGADEARRFVECVENQEHVRAGLAAHGLVAFVADGAVLPRRSGVDERPLAGSDVVPFCSPASLRVVVEVPNDLPEALGGGRTLAGMGIPEGVTLVVGGGYHGKSTLLRAVERAVHPHVPGDGREYVVARPDLVKIRAEDGRRVERVDISAFIGDLPHGRSTDAFSSDDASGSTSQAASIMEALEAGTSGLLLDEDTSATNFMVRDARMQALVARDHEPITPFLDRVRELHEGLGVSTVLVMGGVGDYFDVADTVIMMVAYRPEDVTQDARRIAAEQASRRVREVARPLAPPRGRVPVAASFDASRGRRDVKIDARGLHEIGFGRERIDLRGVEQLVDPSQTRAIGHAIFLAARDWMDGHRTLREVVDALDRVLETEGVDVLDPFRRGDAHPGSFARPRRYEIAAAINRLRTVRMQP